MASFEAINYSLRPSKTIQRSLVFESLRMMKNSLILENMIYVGFGSIWFTDFVLAHRNLGIDDMYSIESEDIGYRRAVFNRPYRTVTVIQGRSGEVLPDLLENDALSMRPWLVWLDYDKKLGEESVDDIRTVVENAPPNSILLVTFNGDDRSYGNVNDRAGRLKDIFGTIVPDDLSKEECRNDRLPQTLAALTRDYMISVAANSARPGGFVSAISMLYRDGAQMVTVGGVLPAKGAVSTVRSLVASPDWPGFPVEPIVAPHLTLRETAVLQSELPTLNPLDRAAIRKLGFDLEEGQIRAFERYYRYYPAFAQIVA